MWQQYYPLVLCIYFNLVEPYNTKVYKHILRSEMKIMFLSINIIHPRLSYELHTLFRTYQEDVGSSFIFVSFETGFGLASSCKLQFRLLRKNLHLAAFFNIPNWILILHLQITGWSTRSGGYGPKCLGHDFFTYH